MARKPREWSQSVKAEIAALEVRGGTAESISAALTESGVAGASRASVGRYLAELRGMPKAARQVSPVAPSAPPLPSTLADIPEGTDVDTFDAWLARAERMAVEAETDGNLKDMGNAGRLVAMLLEAKRKATPRPKEDPNEALDLRAVGKQVAERLHHLVDQIVEP